MKYATNVETGEKVAIKVLDKAKIQKHNMGAQIKKEVWLFNSCVLFTIARQSQFVQISIMKMVKHPNVVRLYEVLASRTKVRDARQLHHVRDSEGG